MFGSHVFVRLPEVRRKCNVNPKAERGVLVGYAENDYCVLVSGTVEKTMYVRLAEQEPVKSGIRCLAGRMVMHACQIGLTDTAPPCPGSPHRACIVTRREEWY